MLVLQAIYVVKFFDRGITLHLLYYYIVKEVSIQSHLVHSSKNNHISVNSFLPWIVSAKKMSYVGEFSATIWICYNLKIQKRNYLRKYGNQIIVLQVFTFGWDHQGQWFGLFFWWCDQKENSSWDYQSLQCQQINFYFFKWGDLVHCVNTLTGCKSKP